MSKSGQRPSKADVGGQRVPKSPKQKPAAQQSAASGQDSKRQKPPKKQP